MSMNDLHLADIVEAVILRERSRANGSCAATRTLPRDQTRTAAAVREPSPGGRPVDGHDTGGRRPDPWMLLVEDIVCGPRNPR